MVGEGAGAMGMLAVWAGETRLVSGGGSSRITGADPNCSNWILKARQRAAASSQADTIAKDAG